MANQYIQTIHIVYSFLLTHLDYLNWKHARWTKPKRKFFHTQRKTGRSTRSIRLMDNRTKPKNYSLSLEECGVCRIPSTRTRPYLARCGASFKRKAGKDIVYCTRLAEFRSQGGYWVCSMHRYRTSVPDGVNIPPPVIVPSMKPLRRSLQDGVFVPSEEPPLPPVFTPDGLQYLPRLQPSSNTGEKSTLEILNLIVGGDDQRGSRRTPSPADDEDDDEDEETPMEFMRRMMCFKEEHKESIGDGQSPPPIPDFPDEEPALLSPTDDLSTE